MIIYSINRLLRQVRRRKALGILLLLSVIAISISGNTLTFYLFDREVQDITLLDSLWYSVVSITTIGYGDFYPITPEARISTTLFIVIVGLATFTTAVGMAVDWVAEIRHKERKGMGKSQSRDHLVIINFPSESRVRQIIREYRSDPQHKGTDIVLISDQIEELPFSWDEVSFIRGWPLDEDTYERANLSYAKQAIVLSPSHSDPRSDSLVASISFVIHRINPVVNVIAECLDVRHAVLFNEFENLSLVFTLEVSNNLLVQEAQDPGVTQLTQMITSNRVKGTLASTKIENTPIPMTYKTVAKNLLDQGVNLVGVIQDNSVRMDFSDIEISHGDQLIYISGSRIDPKNMIDLISGTTG